MGKKIKINNTYKAYHLSYVLNLFCSLGKVHKLQEFHLSCPKEWNIEKYLNLTRLVGTCQANQISFWIKRIKLLSQYLNSKLEITFSTSKLEALAKMTS